MTDIANELNVISLAAGVEASRSDKADHSFNAIIDHMKQLSERVKNDSLRIRQIFTRVERHAQKSVLVGQDASSGGLAAKRLAEEISSHVKQLSQSVDETQEQVAIVVEATAMHSSLTAQVGGKIERLLNGTGRHVVMLKQIEERASDLFEKMMITFRVTDEVRKHDEDKPQEMLTAARDLVKQPGEGL